MARFIYILDHCIPGGGDPEKEVPNVLDTLTHLGVSVLNAFLYYVLDITVAPML
jgi:hypothetical protein